VRERGGGCLLAGSLGDIIMCDWCPMERETLFTDSKERQGWLEVVAMF